MRCTHAEGAAMAEHIEREAAIDAIMSEPPDAHYPQWYADKIKAIPAADVVPVIFCNDAHIKGIDTELKL